MENHTKIKANKVTAWILVLLFALPFTGAHLLYIYQDHFTFRTLETGQLLTPPIQTEALPFYDSSLLGKWQLIYVSPSQCDTSCQTSVDDLNRLHLALGKEYARVTHRSIPATQVPPLSSGEMAIIDPQGWLILRYPPQTQLKGILKDLERLLRFSHLG